MDGFVGILEGITSYVSDLGAAVVLPVLITIFGLILGQRFPQAFKAGVTIGIGFIGINLVIGLMGSTVGPAATQMANNLGVDLSIPDVGWPASAAIAFGSNVGAIIIPLGILVNVVLLAIGLTRTFNIDLWNFWHFAFVGSLIAVLTGQFWLGVAAAMIHMVVILAIADLTAPIVQKYFGYEGISFAHGTSGPYALLAVPFNWLFDRIPGFKRLDASPESIQRRFGFFGDTMIIGLVLGLLIGLFGWDAEADLRTNSITILVLAISLAAVMMLLPRMVALLMEGLMPISESARDFVQRRFPGRQFHIGLDTAVAVGNPAVLATSLVLVPITVIVAIALAPLGNQVLPLVDLATIPFIVAVMVPIFRGNIVRSVIAGAIVIAGGLFISTITAPQFTEVATQSGFDNESGAPLIASLVDGANPMTGLVFGLGNLGGWGILVFGVLAVGFAVLVARNERKRERAAAAVAAQEAETA